MRLKWALQFFTLFTAALLTMSCANDQPKKKRTTIVHVHSDESNLKVVNEQDSVPESVETDGLSHYDSLLVRADSNLLDASQYPFDSIPAPNDDLDDGSSAFEENSSEQDLFSDYDGPEGYSSEEVVADVELAENKLIYSQLLRVVNPLHRDSYDSVLVVIEERLSIRPDPVAEQVVLEKWLSPVNFRGYKFNRKKLVLFGVMREVDVVVYHYLDGYYFSMGSSLYRLDEKFDFASFAQVNDTALTNFLLNSEHGF